MQNRKHKVIPDALDEVDMSILSILSQDAMKPYTEIAKKLIVSPGTIHVRMKKMLRFVLYRKLVEHDGVRKRGANPIEIAPRRMRNAAIVAEQSFLRLQPFFLAHLLGRLIFGDERQVFDESAKLLRYSVRELLPN